MEEYNFVCWKCKKENVFRFNDAVSTVARFVEPPSLWQIAAGIVLAPVLIPVVAAVVVVKKVQDERKKRKPKEMVQKTYVVRCSECETENSIQVAIEKDGSYLFTGAA